MNSAGILYTLSDNIKKSVKNWSPYSWIMKSENLWSVQMLICCKYFKKNVVNNANRHKCLQQNSEEFLHLTLQPCAVPLCQSAQQANDTEVSVHMQYTSYFLVLSDSCELLLLSNCCGKVLLMPGAVGCCKGWKFLRSLVQQFPYQKQRTTDQKTPRACLSVSANMKIWCVLPIAKRGKVLASYTEPSCFLQQNLLCYFI